MNRSFVNMDIQAEKTSLIQWIASLSDESLIAKVKALHGEKADWCDEIQQNIRDTNYQSLVESEKGLSKNHDSVMQKIKIKYNQLREAHSFF